MGRQLGWLPPKPPSQHLGVFPVLPFDTINCTPLLSLYFWVALLPIVITDETEHALDVPDVLGLSGEGDVVVDELAPGDQEDRHSVVVEALVLIGVKVIVIFLHIDKLFARGHQQHLLLKVYGLRA